MTNEQVAPQATPEKQTEDSIPTRRLDPSADVLGAAEWTWGFSTKHTLSTMLYLLLLPVAIMLLWAGLTSREDLFLPISVTLGVFLTALGAQSRSFLLCTISVMILLFPVYLFVFGLLFNP